jgi:hypothetical protein
LQGSTKYLFKKGRVMIFLSALRAVGAFLASLPETLEEAQRLRREFHRRHPFMEY